MDIAVGFFVFNRLDTTMEVFEEIRKAKPSRFYIISDGARESKEGEADIVSKVRSYVEEHIDWDCEVKKNYSEANMGCKKRMASGITWLLENEEAAVIIEDDVKPTQDFFRFMKEMLERYRDDERVMMVSGSMLTPGAVFKDSYLFSHYATIWGWGTWRRAWAHYDMQIKDWPEVKKAGSLKKYTSPIGYARAKRRYDSVYFNRRDTWDTQWSYTVLRQDGFNIVPCVNMIENLGFGREDATHTKEDTEQEFTTGEMAFPLKHPDSVTLDKAYQKLYQEQNWGVKVMVGKLLKRIVKLGRTKNS